MAATRLSSCAPSASASAVRSTAPLSVVPAPAPAPAPAPPRLRAPSSRPRRLEASSGGEGGEGGEGGVDGVDGACAASLPVSVSAPEALSCGPRLTSVLSTCSSSAVALAPRSASLMRERLSSPSERSPSERLSRSSAAWLASSSPPPQPSSPPAATSRSGASSLPPSAALRREAVQLARSLTRSVSLSTKDPKRGARLWSL